MDCIRSVYQYETHNLEIIVVDNDSGDELQRLLIEQYPAVKFIQAGYNAGFARANNIGIKSASGSVVLLLNPDTVILADALNITLARLNQSRHVACGVQLLNIDGSPQISGNYAMKGGLSYLLPLPYVGRLLKWGGNLLKVNKPNIPDASGEIEVDWINGAFLMVKQQAIAKAGLLDEDFFLYAEEAEWCSRLKKAGSLCIFGQEKVIHLQGESANEAFGSTGKGYVNLYDKKGLQIMLSNFVRIRKEFGIAFFLFDLLVYILTIPVMFIILLLSKLFFIRSDYFFSQWEDFSLNVMRLCAYAPKIIRNKAYLYKVL